MNKNDKFKGTPGPWEIRGRDYSELTITDSKGYVLVDGMHIHAGRARMNFPRRKANARLIAAAPELLEALQTMSAIYEVAKEKLGLLPQQPLTMARRAIQKALDPESFKME